MKNDINVEQSSFRDKDGFVFYLNASCYRAVNSSFSSQWDSLMSSGLYGQLAEDHQVIQLEEITDQSLLRNFPEVYKIYKVPQLPFVSYPPEWSFQQIKKAALLTLNIQKKSLEKGFILKDASSYNVQFIGNKALFIDSLSFEPYREGSVWPAYGQFCRHFLAPLLLHRYGYSELQTLFLNYIDGIPLSLCSKLLPLRTRFNFFVYTHLHLHARMEHRHASDTAFNTRYTYSKSKLIALVEHLEMGIRSLKEKDIPSTWTNYYFNNSYSPQANTAKQSFVTRICELTAADFCLDLGTNEGEYAFIAARFFKQVVACDADPQVLKKIQKHKIENVLTLLTDLSNPLPAYGWNSTERKSFLDRAKHNDLTLALALVHHLCIGNNVSLNLLAAFFNRLSSALIIEFVPKEDEQVKKLLVSRKDIFEDYTRDNFEIAFESYFQKTEVLQLPDSGRVLYYFRRKSKHAEN
jgi:ribosomal protein L11 methylase PrmA